jgi:membrane protein
MTVVEAGILVTALITLVIWPQITAWLGLDAVGSILATLAHYAAIVVCVLLSFSLAYYVGPNREQRWVWLTPGSLVGTGLWLVASLAFRTYVQYSANYEATYGALGGVILLLGWIWLSVYILLAGAELNRVVRRACKERSHRSEAEYHGWGSRRPTPSQTA